jgi:hypothetical protein
MSFFPSFGSDVFNPIDVERAQSGQQTYTQAVNQAAGQAVSSLGSKIGGTVGGLMNKVGNLYQMSSKVGVPQNQSYHPTIRYRDASGAIVTKVAPWARQMEQGGRLIPGADRASLGPRFYNK